MRLTLCLEGNTEGRVLASVDMEEIVKMTITDDIEKSNFNPKMLKSATDLAYQCGYHQGRVDAINDFKKSVKELVVDLNVIRFKDIEEIAELLEEQNKWKQVMMKC